MTEAQIDTLIHTTPREQDLMTPASRPFIPGVLPPDQLPEGVPIPRPEVAGSLQHAGGDSMVQRVGLKHLRRSNGQETVFPVCVTGNGDVPIFSSLRREEFARRYGFIPESLFIDALRGYAHATAMITGGADTGLETARVLQAVAIYKHARPSDRPRLDSKLQKDYGLPNLPNAYAQKLTLLDEALAADDQGRRAFGFLSDTGVTPLEAARDVVVKNPGLFLAHLIRTITLWPRAAEVQNIGPLVDKLERIVGSATEANLGQLLFRNDFVYTDINTAVSLLGDLEMALRYPKLHEVADAVLTDRFGIPREVRHNSRYFTALFNRLLVERGIVREEDLDAGDIVTRASVKTPASLLGKAVVSPGIMDTIFNGAEALGVDVQRPDADSPRAKKASWGIRTLSQMLDPRVLENLTEEMMAQDDVIRARVDFKKPEMLNWSLGKIRGVLGTYPPKAREILGRKARGEVFVASNTAEEGTTLTLPLEQPQDEHGYNPEDPAGWMMDWVMRLPRPTSFYAAAHTYLPVDFDGGQLKLLDAQDVTKPVRGVYPGFEVQFALRQIRPACNLRRQHYNREAKMGKPVRLPTDLIQAVQEKVIRDLNALSLESN